MSDTVSPENPPPGSDPLTAALDLQASEINDLLAAVRAVFGHEDLAVIDKARALVALDRAADVIAAGLEDLERAGGVGVTP